MSKKTKGIEWCIQELYLDVEAEIMDEIGSIDFPPDENKVTLDYLADLAYEHGKKVVIHFEDIKEGLE